MNKKNYNNPNSFTQNASRYTCMFFSLKYYLFNNEQTYFKYISFHYYIIRLFYSFFYQKSN